MRSRGLSRVLSGLGLWRKASVAVSTALLLSTFFQVSIALGATFTVNSFADGVDAAPGNGICATGTGVCTLRAAIQETNALAGADTINLPAGIYLLTIPGADEAASATGDLDILDTLTIAGAGAATTIIDASPTPDRVIQVGTSAITATAQISGVTIRGGHPAVGNNGGGLSANGSSNVTLSEVVVTGNNSGIGNGGGLRNDAGTMTITNSVVSNNITSARGGGIESQGGILNVTNTIVSGNTSANGAGGISALVGANATLTNVTVRDNTGLNAGGVVNNTTMTITNGFISGNTGTSGTGGILNTASLTVNGTEISGNHATGAGGIGGGIANFGGTSFATINRALIARNTSTGAGGGIWSGGTLAVNYSTVQSNTTQQGGGGIHLNGGTGTIARSTVSDNSIGPAGSHGGGIRNFGNLTIVDSLVTRNTTPGNGGGIRTDGSLTLNNTTVSQNTSANQGGGIDQPAAPPAATATLINSTLTGNSAAARGGGMRNGNGSTVEISGTTISDNVAGDSGGGLFNAGTATLTQSTVRGNSAVTGGGGIGTGPRDGLLGVTLTIDRSTLSGNGTTGPAAGGALSLLSTNARVINSTISGNTTAFGGTIITLSGSPATTLTMTNTTVASNTGVGISQSSGNTVALLNTIVANNAGANCSGVITSNSHNLSSDASCAFSGPGDMNNTNPLLGPLANNGGPTQTNALLPGSPAIDAGSNVGCPPTDQRGVSRPLDGNANGSVICDIGAYEAQPGTTPKTGAVSVRGAGTAESSLGPVDFAVSVSRSTLGGPVTGSLTKTVRSTGRGIQSTQITQLVVVTSDRVLIKGNCVITPTGEPCTFTADLLDGGPAGAGDAFQVSTNDGPMLGGRVVIGDIAISTS